MTYKKAIKAIQDLKVNESADVPIQLFEEVNNALKLLNIFGAYKYVWNNDFNQVTKIEK